MKVKDLSQPLLSGRMGNLIYYVRNGVQCVRRAEVPGKKRKKERSDQQKGVTGRFAIVQAFYAAYCRQVSRDIWRAAARAEGKMAHNMFNSTNCRCFSGEGKLVDFVNFTFTKGSLLLPRGLKIEQVEGTERRFRVSWQEEREWATATGSDLLQIGVLYDSLPLGPRLAVSVSGRRQDLCGQQTAHTCIAFLPAKTEALIRIVNISGSVPSPLIHSIQHECNEVIRKEKIIRQWIVREDVVFLFTNLAAYKR